MKGKCFDFRNLISFVLKWISKVWFFFLLLLHSCTIHQLSNDLKVDFIPDQLERKNKTFVKFGKWWKSFNMPGLNQMMEVGLKHNNEIQRSYAEMEQVQAALGGKSSLFLPEVSVSNANSKSSSISSTTNKEVITDSFSLNLKASYDIDLFGSKQFQLNSAKLKLLVAIEKHKNLLNQVAGEISSVWFQIMDHQAQLAILKKKLELDQDNIQFIEENVQAGIMQVSELILAERNTIAIEKQIIELKKNNILSHHKFSRLMGNYPTNFVDKMAANFEPNFAPIERVLPSELIQRRPDIRIAISEVKIADQEIGIAVANRFPKLNITASYGRTNSDIQELLDPASAVWNFVGNITIPLFNSGKLKYEVEAKKAILNQKLAIYRDTLLKAFQEVENFLVEIHLQKQTIKLIQKEIALSKAYLNLIQEDFQSGLLNWIQVASAQKELFEVEKSFLAATKIYYQLQVSLYLALGGTWTKDYLVDPVRS